MGKIITIKNNKGGVGKSWITLQLAHLASMLEKNTNEKYKVIILTSDSQNNILAYSGHTTDIFEGLEDLVNKGENTEIRIRENLYYVPLLNNNFSNQFRDKLKLTLNDLKNKYDYIFIDSVPTLNIDKDFVDSSDKIIIPTFLDTATTEGIIKLMDEIDMSKITAIIPNKFTKLKTEVDWYKILKSQIKGTNINLTHPIKYSSLINSLIEKGKTIWESKARGAEETQMILFGVMEELTNE
ncbi:chromosome partitioning protein [Cetobacterium ceti]|uniref:Chromosome partitioning protein n=1 Tax=Cetobacterium ceti TaxID=180163 RepID=A0A1T4PGQ6_9FUSO|nr:ParA family protein [Cetobacterium ceti]SJZ90571.1 chromosome partitioning protein [Cetobacterium ceti]